MRSRARGGDWDGERHNEEMRTGGGSPYIKSTPVTPLSPGLNYRPETSI